jgi:hypothetical protein
MAATTPTLAQIIAGILSEMGGIASIGDLLDGRETLEDDVEFLLRNDFLDETMDVWFIDLAGTREVEGDAAGEVYDVHQIEIRYWSIRTNDIDWSGAARLKAESVRDELAGNANVFRIGGQVQLVTPETVQITEHGPQTIRAEEGEQMVYRTVLQLAVEARRWGLAAVEESETCTPDSASCIIASRVFDGAHQIFGD